MAFTQAQLDALEEAIAIGALTIEYADASGSHRTTYRSLQDMLEVRRLIRNALGITPASSSILVQFDRGTR